MIVGLLFVIIEVEELSKDKVHFGGNNMNPERIPLGLA